MKTKHDPVVIAVAAILIALVSFVGGMEVQKGLGSKTATAAATAPAGVGGFRHGGGIFGTVSSITGTSSMVVQNHRTGASVTVSLSANPSVTDGTGTSSSVGAITAGDTVIVTGTTASDGTVTATKIRLNPTMGGAATSNGSSSGSGITTQ